MFCNRSALFSAFKSCRLRNRLLTIFLCLCPVIVLGHSAEMHNNPGIKLDSSTVDPSKSLPPIDVGGPFSLIDHHGKSVTEQSYAGKHLLVFFGYTNCQIMCPISLSRIGQALEMLATDDVDAYNNLVPMIVTVDPANDTPAQLKKSLASYHHSLIGHTGSATQLKQMYQAYKQSPALIDGQLNEKDIVNHTSFFYLMGAEGELKTLFPPILNPESMAGILKSYIRSDGTI
jgi:protein SCO1/2